MMMMMIMMGFHILILILFLSFFFVVLFFRVTFLFHNLRVNECMCTYVRVYEALAGITLLSSALVKATTHYYPLYPLNILQLQCLFAGCLFSECSWPFFFRTIRSLRSKKSQNSKFEETQSRPWKIVILAG